MTKWLQNIIHKSLVWMWKWTIPKVREIPIFWANHLQRNWRRTEPFYRIEIQNQQRYPTVLKLSKKCYRVICSKQALREISLDWPLNTCLIFEHCEFPEIAALAREMNHRYFLVYVVRQERKKNV